ncbi:MAG: ABC transporter permease [Lachnospiraceae bacterium]|nr:ABC transporter permease [Lachnospiraceae bacterium]
MNITTLIALSNLKVNKTRSILIIITIALTTILLAVLALCATALIKSNRVNSGYLYGEYHARYGKVDDDLLTLIKNHPMFNNVGITANAATSGIADNSLIFSYRDETAIKLNHIDLIEGNFPAKVNEIAGSKELFNLCGLENPQIGDKVTISYRPGGTGLYTEKEFIISGFRKSSEYSDLVKIYAAYISFDFYRECFSEPQYTVYFQIDNKEKLNYGEMEEKILSLALELGVDRENVSINTSYLFAQLDPSLDIVFISALIMFIVILFSVIVIYNIYHIGIIRNIKEYGKLKAIGMTKRQLIKSIKTEGLVLSGIGTFLGLIAGYLIALIIFRLVFALMMEGVPQEAVTDVSLFNPGVLLIVTLLSIFTVFVSLSKSVKIVARVSAIEATKYEGFTSKTSTMRNGFKNLTVASLTFAQLAQNKKRTVTTMLTMGLSCVLFVVIANIAGNMSAEFSARKTLPYGNFKIMIDSYLKDPAYPEKSFYAIQKNRPFDEAFMERVSAIAGVTEIRRRYEVQYLREGISEEDTLLVITEEELKELKKDAKRGSFDYNEVSNENGLIYTWDDWFDYNGYQLNAPIYLMLRNGDELVPFETKIMGSCEGSQISMFVITDKTFEKLDLSGDLTSTVFIDCEKGAFESVKTELVNIVSEMDNIAMISWDETLKFSKMSIALLKYSSYTFLAFVGVIGFLNMVNTMIVGVIARKRELGILSAIGMTKRQLSRMLQLEGLIFTIGTLLISLTIGNLLGYPAFLYSKSMNVFGINHYSIPVLELLIMTILIVLIQAVLSLTLSKDMGKESLVERINYQG